RGDDDRSIERAAAAEYRALQRADAGVDTHRRHSGELAWAESSARRHVAGHRVLGERATGLGKKSVADAIRNGQPHRDLIMFRLCQEFGWTPGQVRALSAVDVQRFMVMLNETRRVPAVAAESNDDTTIVITDD